MDETRIQSVVWVSYGCCSSLLQPTPELHMEMFVSLRVCRPNWCKILWHITEGQSTDLQLICPTSCVFGCSAAGGEIFNQCVSDQDDEAFSEEDVKRLMRQILEGVAFLHQNNVVHLDLKVCGHTRDSPPSPLLCVTCVVDTFPILIHSLCKHHHDTKSLYGSNSNWTYISRGGRGKHLYFEWHLPQWNHFKAQIEYFLCESDGQHLHRLRFAWVIPQHSTFLRSNT